MLYNISTSKRGIEMKKIMIGIVLSCVFFLQGIHVQALEIKQDIVATNYIVMDAHSGYVLLEKNAQEKIDPASMTKIMTAIIVIENTRNFDRMITLTQSDMEFVEDKKASKVGFMKVGDQLTIHDALYGLMLASAGDCAMMLSHSVTGTTDEFVELMNKKAEAIGLSNTHFQNALGVLDENHYSTAEDIAKLLQYAMENEQLRAIMGTDTYTLKPTLSDPIEIAHSAHVIFNKNKVSYENIMIAKTGYEVSNGHCLAAVSKRDDKEIISVVIGSGMEKNKDDSASDTRKLIDYAFDYTQSVSLTVEQLKQEGNTILSSSKYEVQEPITFLVEQELDPKEFQYSYTEFDTLDRIVPGMQVGELAVTISPDKAIYVPVYAASTHSTHKNLILYGGLFLVAAAYFAYQHKRHQAILKGGKTNG